MGGQVMEAHQLSDNVITATDKDRWGRGARHTSLVEI